MSFFVDFSILSVLIFHDDVAEMDFIQKSFTRKMSLVGTSREDLVRQFEAVRRIVNLNDMYFAADDVSMIYLDNTVLNVVFTNECFFQMKGVKPEECVQIVSAVKSTRRIF